MPKFLGGRPSWLAYGVVLGVVLTLAFTQLVSPLFRGETGAERGGELVILSGKDQSAGGQRQALINQWNSLHPDNRAKIIEVSQVADAQRSEMVSRAESAGSEVDIFNLDLIWTAEFAEAGFIRPLSGVDTSGFLEKPLASCRYENQLWALPFNSDAGLLFYRDDLVSKPPSTLDDIVRESARVLGAKPDPRLEAGYTGQLADYEGLTVNAHEVVWAAGGEMVDEKGDVIVDSGAEEGVRWLADGLARDNPSVVLGESRDFHETQSVQAFRDGKVLFMRNWPVAYETLNASAAESQGRPKISFAVAPLPGGSVLGGQNLAISAKSAEPRAAQELIEFLTSPRSQQILFERGGFPATREIVYWDAVINKNRPYANELLRTIRDYARLRPVTPHYTRFTGAFRAGVRQALNDGGKLPPDFKDKLSAALKGH